MFVTNLISYESIINVLKCSSHTFKCRDVLPLNQSYKAWMLTKRAQIDWYNKQNENVNCKDKKAVKYVSD